MLLFTLTFTEPSLSLRTAFRDGEFSMNKYIIHLKSQKHLMSPVAGRTHMSAQSPSLGFAFVKLPPQIQYIVFAALKVKDVHNSRLR